MREYIYNCELTQQVLFIWKPLRVNGLAEMTFLTKMTNYLNKKLGVKERERKKTAN